MPHLQDKQYEETINQIDALELEYKHLLIQLNHIEQLTQLKISYLNQIASLPKRDTPTVK